MRARAEASTGKAMAEGADAVGDATSAPPRGADQAHTARATTRDTCRRRAAPRRDGVRDSTPSAVHGVVPAMPTPCLDGGCVYRDGDRSRRSHRAIERGKTSGRTLIAFLAFLAGSAHAQSVVYVENATAHELTVVETRVSGDPISDKAWKRTADTIAPGARASVLSINRSGKVNWMDPTPRFIEPGKTAVFTTVLRVEGDDTGDVSAAPIELLQKLEGTGKASKMWYAIGADGEAYRAEADTGPREGVLEVGDVSGIAYRYRAYADGERVHVEYVFGGSE